MRGQNLGIPCKTAAGHAELAVRQRGLSQRHRTLLFLVDGQRTVDEVNDLGTKAGVPRGYLDELIALGLVVLAAPTAPPPLSSTATAPTSSERSTALHPWDGWDQHEDTQADGLHADTIGLGLAVTNTQLADVDAQDAGVAEARRLLLTALRAHAPVTGAVTLLRVRRARGAQGLLSLLGEVELRLQRHRDETELRQLLERVARLLA